eukprot:758879-Hanusia_phi.AAC.1
MQERTRKAAASPTGKPRLRPDDGVGVGGRSAVALSEEELVGAGGHEEEDDLEEGHVQKSKLKSSRLS